MISPQLLADLRAKINATELSSHADAILATALPAIDIVLNGPSSGGLGESRFGGTPDLPLGMDWPLNDEGKALTFLAQINLADIPKFDDNPLPASGWLMIFIGAVETAIDIENQLFLAKGEEQIAPATAPADVQWANYDLYVDMPAQKLRLNLRADIPHWGSSDIEPLAASIAPTEDEIGAFEDPLSELGNDLDKYEGAVCIGQLLGHASGIMHDAREDAFIVRGVGERLLYDNKHRATLDMTLVREWSNLLRLDSFFQRDFEFCVWDAGYLNFIIHRDDLAKLDLTRVYTAVETG